jgi:hypothetical protein
MAKTPFQPRRLVELSPALEEISRDWTPDQLRAAIREHRMIVRQFSVKLRILELHGGAIDRPPRKRRPLRPRPCKDSVN